MNKLDKSLAIKELTSHESGQLIKRQMCTMSEGEKCMKTNTQQRKEVAMSRGRGRCSSIYVIRNAS